MLCSPNPQQHLSGSPLLERSRGRPDCWRQTAPHAVPRLWLSPLQTLLLSPAPLRSWGCCWKGEGHTLKGNRVSKEQTLRVSLLRELETCPARDRAVMATEQRGALARVWLQPSSVLLQPRLLGELPAASTPGGKMWLVFRSDLAFPPKALGIKSLHRVAPTQHPQRPLQGIVAPIS